MAQPAEIAATPFAAPYWDACRRGELVVQRCTSCARFVHLPEQECPFCGHGKLTFERVSGEGVVHTFSVIHSTFVPGFAARTPYTVGWIDLPEGVRIFGEITGESVHIGMPVRVSFDNDLPRWSPRD